MIRFMKSRFMLRHYSLQYLTSILLFSACTIPGYAAEMGAVAEEQAAPEGTHGGRLLEDGNFSVELRIFEQGVPPEYHAWAMLDGQQLAPQDWNLEVELSRLGGRVDRIRFVPDGEFLLGDREVEEPHSFDVNVVATYQSRQYQWQFPSYEGRMHLSREMAQAMEISVQTAGSGVIHQTELLYGKISPDPRLISHITARFPGLIRSVSYALGDSVTAGEVIATIEANDSLRTYDITAPISGIVVDSHANPGEFAGDQILLTIADYKSVWADLNVFPSAAQTIRPGQEARIQLGELSTTNTILYLNPGAGLSPNIVARVPLENSESIWTPGLLVEAEVTVDRIETELLVDNRALQSFRDWQVVFIQVGDEYEIRPLELGRSDARFTEVLSGLNAGDQYVVQNSYLIKADLEKSGASHDH